MNPEACRVLVVDDSPSKRYVITSWLRRAGHSVAEAVTGGEALAAIEESSVDVVVLDIRLPDMTGYEVCERIKANPAHSATPVIQISATAVAVSDRTQGLNRGADAYLAEPIDPDELLATVQAVVRYSRARRRVERLANRLATLTDTTLRINAASTYRSLAVAAVSGAACIFGAGAGAALELPEGGQLMATVAHPDAAIRVAATPGSLPDWTGTDADVGPQPARLWRTLLPETAAEQVWIATVRARDRRSPVLLAVDGDFGEDDLPLLRQLGQALALATEAMRTHDEERRIALTLQRSLLPKALPAVDGLDVAVRYVPASERTEIGGDFYELALLDDRLVVAIGDVGGHSLHAATVMAELRHALRAYVIERYPPAVVLARLNNLMLRLLPDEIATVCLLVLDPATGDLTMANAGHLPPILVVDGRAEPATLPGSMLGVDVDVRQDARLHLPAGGTLLLVTDGLVERRDRSFDAGMRLLFQVANPVDDDLDLFCDRLLRELDSDRSEDDIALVAIRRR
jgi:CheY-like chemotaxis protein